jgi:sugar phosphate isomerase/epimerase
VEVKSPFIESQDEGHLKWIRDAADHYDITIVNLAIDDWDYDLSSTDEDNRRQAIDRTVAWLDAAVTLKCEHVRNNTGGQDFEKCVESFTTLAAEAKSRDRKIVIEPHGGFSSDADQLIPLIDMVRQTQPDHIGLVPDFGNVVVTEALNRYQQIEKMASYAMVVHTKMNEFDTHGQQPEWDTIRLVNSIKRTGYRGTWMIEFEGKEDEFSGLQKSIVLLSNALKNW